MDEINGSNRGNKRMKRDLIIVSRSKKKRCGREAMTRRGDKAKKVAREEDCQAATTKQRS
jgi:hypothetical protein